MKTTHEIALKKILAQITVDDIASPLEGELPDVSGEDFTAWYGNRELIVYLADEEEAQVYFVDIYGDRKVLVKG